MGMNRITRKQLPALRRHRLALALVGAMAMPPAFAQDLPQGGAVVASPGTNASIATSGTQMTITQSSKGAIINWNNFSIGTGYGVTFAYDNVSSVTLNRVTGGSASLINGSLRTDGNPSGNGSVFIINPAGITFGGGAQVSVGGLVASTMDISDANFLAGVASGAYQFEPMTTSGSQAVTVDMGGQITADPGGTVALIGRQVSNSGTISAAGGSVLFGSAQNVTLDFQGDGLTMLTIQGPGISEPASGGCPSFPCPPPVNPQLLNFGTVSADGGQILMRTAASALGGGDIINAGTLQAQSLVSRNGRIELTTDGAVSLGYSSPVAGGYAGTLDVSSQAGAGGGTVLVRASDFAMFNNDAAPLNPTGTGSTGSLIDASGDTNGGVVDILATNLARVYSLSSILADGTGGRGGQVSLVAGTTELGARAQISANGGAGAGGRIDVSGSSGLSLYGLLSATGTTAGGRINTSTSADNFDLRGLRVEAGSPAVAGTWTLSLPSLTILSGDETGELDNMAGGTDVQDAQINHALGNATNVVIQSSGDVYIDDASITAGSDVRQLFAINADGRIDGGNFAIESSTGPLDMHFNADASGSNPGFGGIDFVNATLGSRGGNILMYGQSNAANGSASGQSSGIRLNNVDLFTNGGSLLLRGASAGVDADPDGAGVTVGGGGNMDAGTGAIMINGTGALGAGGVRIDGGWMEAGAIDIRGTATGSGDGIWLDPYAVRTVGGGIFLAGNGGGRGVFLTGYSGLYSNGGGIVVQGVGGTGNGVDLTGEIESSGGQISLIGRSAQAHGLMYRNDYGYGIQSGGGAISLIGDGATGGVTLIGGGYGTSAIDSGGGQIDIEGTASGSSAAGVTLSQLPVLSGSGNISVVGNAAAGTSIVFGGGGGLIATSGDIRLAGVGVDVGLMIDGGVAISTDSGHLDLRGRGTAAGADGLVIGSGVTVATAGGGIALAGEGRGGAGLIVGSRASLDAGDSLVVVRASNDGSSDAIRIAGTIHGGAGVNLRPGGVDADGNAYDRTGDGILLGDGNGFALNGSELALIDAPELVIGSNLHVGAIRVSQDVTRAGNLTLQNQGGGGIDLQAGVDVGDATLALLSGGSITQASTGVIHAHSLLAQADGDVLLGIAQNDVASTTLAGSAGGDFEFQDANALAIGSVSANGFDATAGAMMGLAGTGISAGGDALVRNLAGDMTLNAGVTATDIDLVTAGRLQNATGAGLNASGDWRVWASTWDGENRGGLNGSGNLPNLYGCAYLGACGVTVSGGDNHFIYVQQPGITITVDNAFREYGLVNPVFTYTVSGGRPGDTAAATLVNGSTSTVAGIGSDVGQYPILGNFTSDAGYLIQVVPGVLTITQATLLFTADAVVRYLGTANPRMGGTVTGFRNGDTLESVFGSDTVWSSPAGLLSPIGFYPINGGVTAKNYVVTQAPGNATALQIIPLPHVDGRPVSLVHETVETYVYDRNLGTAPPVCAVNASMNDQPLASAGDALAMEWSKVRTRPNLTNCFDSERHSGCSDF